MRVYRDLCECLKAKGKSPCLYVLSEFHRTEEGYYMVKVRAIDPTTCRPIEVKCLVKEVKGCT